MTSVRSGLDILRGILTGTTAYAKPLYVNVDPTHRCNLQCAYCRWHSPLLDETLLDESLERDLSPEVFRRFCADARGTGLQTLQFVGAGEPLLHPDIAGLLGTAKAFGYRTLLYSNGLLLDEQTVRMLVDAQLDVLRVTLGDTTAEQFDRMHPRVKPGALDRILQGLARVTRVKQETTSATPTLEIGVPLSREVVADLDTMIGIAANAGCDGLFFSVVLDFGQEELKPFCLGPAEVEGACRVLRQVRERLDTLGLRHNIDGVIRRYALGRRVWKAVPCYSAWYFTFLRSDGKVTVCQRGQDPMGDLRLTPFGEIWNGERYRDFRRRALRDPDSPYDCEFCPHAVNNHRIHRVVGGLMPVFGQRRMPVRP